MKKILFLAIQIIAICTAQAQTDTTKQIDNIFSSWNNATPGGSILVARGEKIIYHKAFGLADLEHNTPNTTETVFESGSVAKQFVAASVLLLASEGKLSMQDDVRKYIPELPQYNATITIQHLMNHTSGIKDWGSLYSVTGWPRATRVYTQELALDIICKQNSLNFTPGAEYSYSNSNYVLLAFIVERLSKQSFSDFTRTKFYEPLQMTNTKWRYNFKEVIKNRAIAYAKYKDNWYQDMPFENVHGPGGMLTITSDLFKWNQLLVKKNVGNDVFASSRVQHGVLNNGNEIVYSGGVSVGIFNGTQEVSHSGATAGYRAWLAYYPEKKLSVVILSNDGSFGPVGAGRQLAGIFIPAVKTNTIKPKSTIVDETDLKKFAGIYREVRGYDVMNIEYKENKLRLGSREFSASHQDTLFLDNMRVVFKKKGMLVVNPVSDSSTYKIVMPPDSTARSLQTFAGLYYSKETDANWIVEFKDGSLSVKQGNLVSFKLIPVFRDAFSTGNNGLVEFRRDKKGKITGLYVSIPRAEKIPFERMRDGK
jgi:CubicO group peptidase (beta-lactamase class C family)